MFRIVEVMTEFGWNRVRLHEVKKGDTFRMFEPDNMEAVVFNNKTEFVASEDATDKGVVAE